MLENLNELFISFQEFTQQNQVISGIISLWGLGVITFLLRNVPVGIYNLISRQVTTSLVINNQDSVYYNFLNWVSNLFGELDKARGEE